MGALIFNVHLFMAPDFDGTEPAKKIKNRMAKLGEYFDQRDMDNILGVLPDFMYPTGGADGVEATKKAYAEALSSASEKFWKLSALQPSWNFDHLTTILSSQEEWHMDSPPVVLACSDQAPLVVVSESTQRLHHLLPGSKLEFIPSSKWSWQLEGDAVLASVTELLDTLLPRRLSDKHLNKRSSLLLLGQQVRILALRSSLILLGGGRNPHPIHRFFGVQQNKPRSSSLRPSMLLGTKRFVAAVLEAAVLSRTSARYTDVLKRSTRHSQQGCRSGS